MGHLLIFVCRVCLRYRTVPQVAKKTVKWPIDFVLFNRRRCSFRTHNLKLVYEQKK